MPLNKSQSLLARNTSPVTTARSQATSVENVKPSFFSWCICDHCYMQIFLPAKEKRKKYSSDATGTLGILLLQTEMRSEGQLLLSQDRCLLQKNKCRSLRADTLLNNLFSSKIALSLARFASTVITATTRLSWPKSFTTQIEGFGNYSPHNATLTLLLSHNTGQKFQLQIMSK